MLTLLRLELAEAAVRLPTSRPGSIERVCTVGDEERLLAGECGGAGAAVVTDGDRRDIGGRQVGTGGDRPVHDRIWVRTVVFNVVCTSPALTRLHQCPAPGRSSGRSAAPVVVVALRGPFDVAGRGRGRGGSFGARAICASAARVEATRPASRQTTRNGVVVDMIRSPRCLPTFWSSRHQQVKRRLNSGMNFASRPRKRALAVGQMNGS